MCIANSGIFEVHMWCLSYTSLDIHKSKCHTQINTWKIEISYLGIKKNNKKNLQHWEKIREVWPESPCFVQILHV